MMETIGGRKFIGLLLLMVAGVVTEVYAKNGLSAVMAGFLAGLYATFVAANAVITSKELGQPVAAAAPEQAEPGMVAQVETVLQQIANALTTLQQAQSRTEQALNSLQQSTASTQKGIGALLSSRQED